MRTDEQKKLDAKASVDALNIDELRHNLFVASILLELKLLDLVAPIMDEKTTNEWVETTWALLCHTRNDAHMEEIKSALQDRAEKIKLFLSETETAQ